jgi:hypothetical protein
MTKAILEFNLPDEKADFDAAIHGKEALSVIFDIYQRCRSLLKHGNLTHEQVRLAEEIQDMIPFYLTEM